MNKQERDKWLRKAVQQSPNISKDAAAKILQDLHKLTDFEKDLIAGVAKEYAKLDEQLKKAQATELGQQTERNVRQRQREDLTRLVCRLNDLVGIAAWPDCGNAGMTGEDEVGMTAEDAAKLVRHIEQGLALDGLDI